MTFLNRELDFLAEEIASAREDVTFADTLALSSTISQRERAARIKSLALIQLAASFERFLSACIEKINIELSTRNLKSSQVKNSLLALAFHDTFTSIKNTEGEKSLHKRLELIEKLYNTDGIDLNNIKSSTIYGGKTPRKKHIELIWSLYSIHQNLPSPQHLLALDGLADTRNAIAHGEITTTSAGRRKTTNDMLTLINKISDLSIYLAQIFEDYVNKSIYKK